MPAISRAQTHLKIEGEPEYFIVRCADALNATPRIKGPQLGELVGDDQNLFMTGYAVANQPSDEELAEILGQTTDEVLLKPTARLDAIRHYISQWKVRGLVANRGDYRLALFVHPSTSVDAIWPSAADQPTLLTPSQISAKLSRLQIIEKHLVDFIGRKKVKQTMQQIDSAATRALYDQVRSEARAMRYQAFSNSAPQRLPTRPVGEQGALDQKAKLPENAAIVDDKKQSTLSKNLVQKSSHAHPRQLSAPMPKATAKAVFPNLGQVSQIEMPDHQPKVVAKPAAKKRPNTAANSTDAWHQGEESLKHTAELGKGPAGSKRFDTGKKRDADQISSTVSPISEAKDTEQTPDITKKRRITEADSGVAPNTVATCEVQASNSSNEHKYGDQVDQASRSKNNGIRGTPDLEESVDRRENDGKEPSVIASGENAAWNQTCSKNSVNKGQLSSHEQTQQQSARNSVQSTGSIGQVNEEHGLSHHHYQDFEHRNQFLERENAELKIEIAKLTERLANVARLHEVLETFLKP